MRKIEELARTAFYNGYNFKRSNTEVKISDDSVNYYLHGNLIAKKSLNTGTIYMTLSGWNTATTKSRLRSLGANLTTKNSRVFHGLTEISTTSWFYL